MSDFIFSSQTANAEGLGQPLAAIPGGAGEVVKRAGPWGALAVRQASYAQGRVAETDRYLAILIGDPVAQFTDISPQAAEGGLAGSVLHHWLAGGLDWSEALDGPFAALIIDKQDQVLHCVTDLMLAIPVYRAQGAGGCVLGTHVDVVARVAGRAEAADEASLADFILHDVVTYPFTAYQGVSQCAPATVHTFHRSASGHRHALQSQQSYWCPIEACPYADSKEAGLALRDAVAGYVDQVSGRAAGRVAQFLSAGEDSRVIAGLLPGSGHSGFVFLDAMNREGQIAERVADAYGVRFRPGFRGALHYLQQLPRAAELLGAGQQGVHAHALGFEDQFRLADYGAVFGGYLADALVKGLFIGRDRAPVGAIEHPFLPTELLSEVVRRRREHLRRVREFRPDSAREWFELWPLTMRRAFGSWQCNRRLFNSHEPFMASSAIKVAAAVPQAWKVRRELYLAAFRPALHPSRRIRLPDGRLPTAPYWLNRPLQAVTQRGRALQGRLFGPAQHHGPWADWPSVMRSGMWQRWVAEAGAARHGLSVLDEPLRLGALQEQRLGIMPRLNLVQACQQHGGQALPIELD